MAKLTGGCLCGDIRYEINAPPLFAGHCHCRDCQQASGAGHSTAAAFPMAALRIVQGAPARYESKGDSGQDVVREFCPRCGSRLFSHASRSPAHVMVAVVSLDDPDAVAPMAHIYDKSRRSWDAPDPGLPSFAVMPPGF